ncbi:CopG family transcriptional regulator [Candidatus Parabeggiatoa sp. HSG14]|uniref:CopG family transcriptional regulator n=1 Tax=Candidatus Parabeggiatoa sp. HSG14 TaxID=3055593 RepID=UPI0025A6CD73|nr:CopG family transcriptional regulator [Thiotrichales bacterium HSG14]
MSTLTIELPPQIYQNIQNLVFTGWFKDVNSVVEEALRRYLESHPTDLMEQFVNDDIEWGLRGND